MGRPGGCKHHDQGGLSVCSSTCLPVDAQGGYWGTAEILARTIGRAGGQRLVSAKEPSFPTSGDCTGLPSSLSFPHTCGRSSLHARAHLHTEAKDTDPYIHKWLIHTQAQHVPQLHSCDQLNPNWLSRTEYLTFRPQNLKNPGPGTQGRVSESKGQKVQWFCPKWDNLTGLPARFLGFLVLHVQSMFIPGLLSECHIDSVLSSRVAGHHILPLRTQNSECHTH